MFDRIKVAIIGCGEIVRARRRGYREVWEKDFKYFDIVTTCDLVEAHAERLATEVEAFQGTRPRVYQNFQQVLDSKADVTLVDIATDHRSHHQIAVPCFEAGKDVIIAKPLGISMRACKVMVDAAQNNNRLLAVAENARRSPQERAINWAVRTGKIGKPRMLFWHQIAERLGTWGWRDFKSQAGGGWVLDGGIHYTDLFRYHLGDAKSVYAATRQFESVRYRKPETKENPIDVTVEDTTMAIIQFESGALVQWNDCRVAREKQFNSNLLYSSEGCIDWNEGLKFNGQTLPMDELIQQFMAAIGEAEREKLFPAAMTYTFSLEIKALGEVDGTVGLKAEAIPMGIYESSWLGQSVELSQIENCQIENYQQEINESVGL